MVVHDTAPSAPNGGEVRSPARQTLYQKHRYSVKLNSTRAVMGGQRGFGVIFFPDRWMVVHM
jgi:hypothetical protein